MFSIRLQQIRWDLPNRTHAYPLKIRFVCICIVSKRNLEIKILYLFSLIIYIDLHLQFSLD